jgi:hypothetical protein
LAKRWFKSASGRFVVRRSAPTRQLCDRIVFELVVPIWNAPASQGDARRFYTNSMRA